MTEQWPAIPDSALRPQGEPHVEIAQTGRWSHAVRIVHDWHIDERGWCLTRRGAERYAVRELRKYRKRLRHPAWRKLDA